MDKRHKAAMDYLLAHEAIQQASTQGVWIGDEYGTVLMEIEPDENGKPRTHGYDCANDFICCLNDGGYHEYTSRVEQDGNQTAIATSHNLSPALLAGYKYQLQTHYDQWTGWSNDEEDWETDDCSTAYFINQQHRKLCEILAKPDCPELADKLQALRTELNEEN